MEDYPTVSIESIRMHACCGCASVCSRACAGAHVHTRVLQAKVEQSGKAVDDRCLCTTAYKSV